MDNFPDFQIQATELHDPMEIRKMGERYHISMLCPHRNNFYILFWATAGRGSHLINHDSFDILPGRLYLIQPEHTYQVKTYPRQGWMILFSRSMFSNFLSHHPEQEDAGLFSFFNSCPYLDLNEKRPLFNSLANRLFKELKKSPQISVLEHFLSIMLLYINEGYAVQEKLTFIAPETQLMLKLKKLINSNYKLRRDTEYYANKLGTNSRILNRLSKKILGNRVRVIIRERVLATAKEKLAANTSTIKQIAIDLNFSDSAHFVSFFKKHLGLTPTEFKKKLKE